MAQYIEDQATWAQAHPEEAQKWREQVNRDEFADDMPDQGGAAAAAVAAAEGAPPPAAADPAKPADAPAAPATPQLLDEWMAKTPALKAALDADPEMKAAMESTVAQAAAAAPILEIASTVEEAKFHRDTANELVSLRANLMMAPDDPAALDRGWTQIQDMFTTIGDDGKVVLDKNGKPQLAQDFYAVRDKFVASHFDEGNARIGSEIAALEAKLGGHYPNEQAKLADQEALTNAKYAKAALDYALEYLKGGQETDDLPALPAGATPEQIAFQKKLEDDRAALRGEQGKQTKEQRQAASREFNQKMQSAWGAGIGGFIEGQLKAMTDRGEYLPDFVLAQKWRDPKTGQESQIREFGMDIYQQFNAKVYGNPYHFAKLAELQALGPAGEKARLEYFEKLRTTFKDPVSRKPWLQKIFDDKVASIQNGIRKAAGQNQPPAGTAPVARVEPTSAGGGAQPPARMDEAQLTAQATERAKKDPGWANADEAGKSALISEMRWYIKQGR